MSTSIPLPQVGSRYCHYKNKKEYRIIGVGNLQVSTKELDHALVVIYQALYDDPTFGKNHLWVRPVKDFMGMVEHEGNNVLRFSLVGE